RIRRNRWPVRILTAGIGGDFARILSHLGLSKEINSGIWTLLITSRPPGRGMKVPCTRARRLLRHWPERHPHNRAGSRRHVQPAWDSLRQYETPEERRARSD